MSGWAGPGGSWCLKDHGVGVSEWWKLYDYPSNVQQLWGLEKEKMQKHVLGSLTLMWGEGVDEQNFEQKVWPRSSALAGSLWAHDFQHTNRVSSSGVEQRFQSHRHRMVKRGIAAEATQPLWCNQNGNACSFMGEMDESWGYHKQKIHGVKYNMTSSYKNIMPAGYDCDGRQDIASEDLFQC